LKVKKLIKRIRKIKGIGRFLRVGHTEFGHLTLIYGPNCYGKSTLSDVFRSLANQNPDVLLNRQSIKRDGNPITQEVCFSFKSDFNNTEQDISFINQEWDKKNFNCLIEVFDSRFIEDNVFTGLTISRLNKKNLTNLLIGDKSVDLGRKIDNLKKSFRKKTNDISDFESLLKRNLDDLDVEISLQDFISIVKPEDIRKTKSKLKKFQESLDKIKKVISEKKKVSELKEPSIIDLKDPIPIVESIKESLVKGFKNINDTDYNRMRKHIEQHFACRDGEEEQWLEKGINTYLKHNNNIIDSNCPFCSQPLNTVLDLIETYKAVFGEEYESFCNGVFDKLDKKYQEFNTFLESLRSLENWINKNSAICLRWQDFFTENKHDLFDKIDEVSLEIDKTNRKLLGLTEELADKFENIIDLKKKKPFVPINEFPSIADLSSRYKEFKRIRSEYNKVLRSFIFEIQTLKRRSSNDEVIEESKSIKVKIAELITEIKRHELASDIDKLKLFRKEKDEIKKEIREKQIELERENKEFIEHYFQETTEIFNRLGSNDFEIETTYSRRGDQPVYEPIIKFADVEITNDRLPYVFSDADRRALAFSIFIAKLKKKSETELKNTIVILDDPITSFDDNRISQTFIEIKKLSTDCRQLIIAAHHSRFLLDTYEKLRILPDSDLKFIEIKRDGYGSIFRPVDDPKTRLDAYAQELEKVERFINADPDINVSDVRRSLRPILQKELEWRFRRKLKEIYYDGLGGLVTKLREANLISAEIAQQLYDFNDVLKDDHHDTISDIDEDTRALSRDIMEFIFERLNPEV